jgi:hypothetical protein
MPPAMRDRLAGSEATVGGDERRCARRWRAATRPGAHRDRGATTVLRGPGEAGRSWPQAADRGSPAGDGHVAGQRHLVVAGDGSEIGDLDHREACEPRAIADCEGSQATSSLGRTRCRSRARRALIGSPATTPRHIRLAAPSRSASYARHPKDTRAGPGPPHRHSVLAHGAMVCKRKNIQDRRTRSAYGARMTSSRRTAPSPVPRNRRPPRG